MKRLVLALVVPAVWLAACSNGVHVLPPEELPADLYSVPPASPKPSGAAAVRIYLVRNGRLAPASRTDTTGRSPLEFAVHSLLEGPTPQETAEGLATAIPPGAELIHAEVTGSVAILNLTGEFQLGADQDVLALRLAQVVFTATGTPGVTRVEFLIDGEPVDVVGDDAQARSGPVGRKDYASLAPLSDSPN